MAIAPAAASAAYQAIANIGSSASAPAAPAAGGQAQNFSQFLEGAMKDAMSTMRQGEKMAAGQVQGKADMVSVVSAVNNAELTLDTVVAVRDKVISAYQSILQMPI